MHVPPHFNHMLMIINIGAICVATFSVFIALGNLPPAGSVQGLRILGQSAPVTVPPLPALDNCVTIGAGLPPVPAKFVSRIEAGEYIDMTELLPDRLGTLKSPVNDDSFKAGRQ